MKKREKNYLFNKKLARILSNTLKEEVTKAINEEIVKVLKCEINLEDSDIVPFKKNK